MTVKELIEALQQFPDNAFVYSEIHGYYDSEDGMINIQGYTTGLTYNNGLLHITADFDTATIAS